MASLAVEADLSIDIDGQEARLSGSGRDLTLRLASAAMLRDMLNVSLPDVRSAGDKVRTLANAPQILKNAGLTLTVRDDKGPAARAG